MPRATFRAVLALVGVWIAWFSRQIFSTGVPFRRDALFVHLPGRQVIHDALTRGVLPQWFPYEGVGVPFIGQIVTATFHPQTLLFLPLSPLQAMKWNILAAYLFGLVGGYKLARGVGASRTGAWAGGASLAFGGYALSMSDNLPYLGSLCTLPWIGWAALRLVWRADGRNAAILGVLWALVFLGGDAQMFACAPLVMLAAVAGSRVTPRSSLVRVGLGLGLAGVIAALCCGAELLPALAVYSRSARAEGQWVIDIGTYWALHPWRLLELVTPGFLPPEDRVRLSRELFHDPFVWASSLFAGGIVMWLAIAGAARRERRTWIWFAVAMLAVWESMGSAAGLWSVVAYLPYLGEFRFPEKYMALFWVALVPLVGLGWDAAVAAPRRWASVGGAMAMAAVLVSVLPLPTPAWGEGLRVTAVMVGLAAICLLSPRLQVFVPLLLVAELWRGNVSFLPVASPDLFDERQNPVAETVKQEPTRGLAPPRVMNDGGTKPVSSDSAEAAEAWVRQSMLLMRPDSAALTHIGVIGLAALPAYGGRPRELFGPKGVRSEAMSGLMNACFRTSIQEGQVSVTPQSCRPRAYLAALRPVPDSDAALKQLEDGLGEQEAVWEGSRAVPLATGTVQWEAWEPGAFRLKTETMEEAALVVSEGFAQGWTATIDGAPAAITPANVAVMAMVVPAGSHTIAVRYEAPRLKLGMAMSLMGIALALGLGFNRLRT